MLIVCISILFSIHRDFYMFLNSNSISIRQLSLNLVANKPATNNMCFSQQVLSSCLFIACGQWNAKKNKDE